MVGEGPQLVLPLPTDRTHTLTHGVAPPGPACILQAGDQISGPLQIREQRRQSQGRLAPGPPTGPSALTPSSLCEAVHPRGRPCRAVLASLASQA